ncbi:glycosyltransferase family 4 protein [Pseudomonas sp. BMS12]|uniref:glycosyltransferase family 4 protein n=1 Tax=Pseudomonas sp. BMS12 TaxID=1796033 RepID=UPI00083B3337|nr:glycosyltransferase family 4 protein [Pseudomonas sp. BMS12]
MRILWILPYLPWPTSSGGKTRQYHLLRTLAARGHRITLLVQAKQALDEEARQALEPLLEQLIVLPRRGLRHPLTLATALFGPWPLLTCVNGLAPALERRFAELLKQSWDVVQVEHSYSFQPYAKALKAAEQAFILTEHNLESSLGGATYSRFPRWLAPFVRFDQWRARRWERQVFDAATRVVAVTEADAKAMRSLTHTAVEVVVNGVDCRGFAEVQRSPQSQRILFVGNYEYPPNVDAVSWALDEIMPRLWQQCPTARFIVAGYAMPSDWAQCWPDPRIEWRGFVDDLRTLQAESSLFLAPLRQGGGSKLKVLEALAAGLPLVSTAQGVSGLALRDGHDYRHGDEASALSAALAELLNDASQADSLATAGRRYVNQQHDWQAAASQLEAVYQQLIDKECRACA